MQTSGKYHIRMVVTERSMSPSLSPGDNIVVRKATLQSIRTGDIIVYKVPSRTNERKLVVHRAVIVLRIKRKYFILTIGDVGCNPDVTREENLIGIAVAQIKANEIVGIKRETTLWRRIILYFRFINCIVRILAGKVIKKSLGIFP